MLLIFLFITSIPLIQGYACHSLANMTDAPAFLSIQCNEDLILIKRAFYGATNSTSPVCEFKSSCVKDVTHDLWDVKECQLQNYCDLRLFTYIIPGSCNKHATEFGMDYECVQGPKEKISCFCGYTCGLEGSGLQVVTTTEAYIYRTNDADKTGFLTTPNYPHLHPSFSSCTCSITAGLSDTIMMEVLHLDLEYHENCIYDYIEITSAEFNGRFCGIGNWEPRPIARHEVNVTFKSDQNINSEGALIRYWAVNNLGYKVSATSSCKSTDNFTTYTSIVTSSTTTTSTTSVFATYPVSATSKISTEKQTLSTSAESSTSESSQYDDVVGMDDTTIIIAVVSGTSIALIFIGIGIVIGLKCRNTQPTVQESIPPPQFPPNTGERTNQHAIGNHYQGLVNTTKDDTKEPPLYLDVVSADDIYHEIILDENGDTIYQPIKSNNDHDYANTAYESPIASPTSRTDSNYENIN